MDSFIILSQLKLIFKKKIYMYKHPSGLFRFAAITELAVV